MMAWEIRFSFLMRYRTIRLETTVDPHRIIRQPFQNILVDLHADARAFRYKAITVFHLERLIYDLAQ